MKINIESDATVHLLHLTDSHLCSNVSVDGPPKSFAEASLLLNGITTNQSFARVLDDAAGVDVDVVLHTGDLVESPGTKAYETAMDHVLRVGRPLLICAGNHDDPAMLASILKTRRLPRRYIDAGVWRVIVVDSYGGDHSGQVGEAELEALYEHACAWDGPVLVGLHHPPVSTCQHPDCSLNDAGEFLSTLRRVGNVVAVASGHLHCASETETAGVRYLLGPSTCLQLKHKHPLPEHNRSGTKGGARRIQLLPSGEVKSTLHWV